MISSMTGYATRYFTFQNGSEKENYKIEIKSLNHRFLDLKIRMPKEWVTIEPTIRPLVEKKIGRGAVELWIEKFDAKNSSATEIHVNSAQADRAIELLRDLQKKYQISEDISIRDLITFPDVISKGNPALNEDVMSKLSQVLAHELNAALDDLVKMRKQEGEKVKSVILSILEQFKNTHQRFLGLRTQMQKRAQEKIRKKIEQCFEAYSTPDAQMRALMETRIAQEIAYSLDKMDIEEELNRFKGHVDQLGALVQQGGLVGKKMDFMFQELNREVNTLGNKAQDLDVSHDVIEIKTWIEQLREQSLNIE